MIIAQYAALFDPFIVSLNGRPRLGAELLLFVYGNQLGKSRFESLRKVDFQRTCTVQQIGVDALAPSWPQ